MLAAARRHEETLARKAAEAAKEEEVKKAKKERLKKIEEEQEERKKEREEEQKKIEEAIAKGIVYTPTIHKGEIDPDHLSPEEELLLFGEHATMQDDFKAFCNKKNTAKITLCVFFFITAVTAIVCAALGLFDSILTNPCWTPTEEVAATLLHYNTTTPLPNHVDPLIESWATKRPKHSPYVLPTDWCNGIKTFYDTKKKKNISYVNNDAMYLWGRYYLEHPAGGACVVQQTITLDSMCSDPNATLGGSNTPSPSSSSIIEDDEDGTNSSSSSSSSSTRRKKKKIKLKDPCWLTIQGHTDSNQEYWDWLLTKDYVPPEGDDSFRRRNLAIGGSKKPAKKDTSPDPFVPMSLTKNCRTSDIATTKRGKEGVPKPVCRPLVLKTVLDGGGVRQMFRVTQGAKLSLRDLILRNGRAGGHCFCKYPFSTCAGGAIYVSDPKTHLLVNNAIMQGNQAWMGGAVFGYALATISLVSVDVVNNLALKNDTKFCQGGGYGGGLYMYNETILTTICTNVRFNQAGDSGGGVTLQNASNFVALTTAITNNTAKLNQYMKREDPLLVDRSFYVGRDIRMYESCKFRALKGCTIDAKAVFPLIDVKNDVYLEMYYSAGEKLVVGSSCWWVAVCLAVVMVLVE